MGCTVRFEPVIHPRSWLALKVALIYLLPHSKKNILIWAFLSFIIHTFSLNKKDPEEFCISLKQLYIPNHLSFISMSVTVFQSKISDTATHKNISTYFPTIAPTTGVALLSSIKEDNRSLFKGVISSLSKRDKTSTYTHTHIDIKHCAHGHFLQNGSGNWTQARN